jgi:hypothetical protein
MTRPSASRFTMAATVTPDSAPAVSAGLSEDGEMRHEVNLRHQDQGERASGDPELP